MFYFLHCMQLDLLIIVKLIVNLIVTQQKIVSRQHDI